MRFTGFAVALGALLAAGGAGWLLWDASESGDDAEAQERSAAVTPRQGPLLTGRVSARGAGDAQADEGAFAVTGVVVDGAQRPVAGILVEARFVGALHAPGAAAGDYEPRALVRAFAPADAAAETAPHTSATSGADGAFALIVRRRGVFMLRPAVAPPLIGIEEPVTVEHATAGPVTLRVLRGSALRGRVIDAADRGVDARVTAAWYDGAVPWRAPEVATAAGTGAFTLAAVPDGTLQVEVRLPGRLIVAVEANTPRTDELVIRLGTSAPLLAGTVRDLEGRAIADARVGVALALPAAGGLPGYDVQYFAASDAEGRYRISGPFTGAVTRVQAAAHGFLDLNEYPPLPRWSGLRLNLEQEAVLDLTLWRGGTLTGTVREQGSGAPLAGAVVTVMPAVIDGRLSATRDLEAVSDAQGRYSVAGLPVGRSIVLVHHATHYLPAFEALPHPPAGDEDVEIEEAALPAPPPEMAVFLARQGDRMVHDVILVRGLEITGRVEDPAGKPVAGADVRTTCQDLELAWTWHVGSPERSLLARSDAEGRFRVTGLAPRREWSLYATKKGWLGDSCDPFPLSAEVPPPEVVLRLAAPATLVGRVVDAAGNGCAGLEVDWWPNSGRPLFREDGTDVVSGPDGAFRCEDVQPGEVELNVSSPEHGSGRGSVSDLVAGEVREGVSIVLVPQHILSGMLVDEQGVPAPWKALAAKHVGGSSNASTVSGRNGVFRLALGIPGKVQITPDGAPDLELAVAEVPAKDVRVVWKEPPTLVVEGLVTDPAGRAVPCCRVQMKATVPPNLGIGWIGGPAVNGWFRRRVRGVVPLEIEVTGACDAKGRRLNLKDKKTVLADLPSGPVTIALEPGLVVSGSVLDPLGRPLPGVVVRANKVHETTDEQGAFRLGGLAADAESVSVSCLPLAPWLTPAPQTVAPGTEDVVFRLKAGLAISGRVIDVNGRPVTEASVEGTWPDSAEVPAGSVDAAVGRDGRFRMEGFPASVIVLVTVETYDDESPPRRVSGVRPGTEGLVIDMGAGVTVEGIVVDAQGRPFSRGNVSVALREDGEDGNGVDLAQDGTFRASGLPPGPVWIAAFRNGGGPGTGYVRFEAPTTKARLVLPPTTPIAGRLVGTGGTAFWVWTWNVANPQESAYTQELDAEGRFTIEGAGAGGTWMVAARPHTQDDDRYALAGPFPSGTQDVTLEMRVGRAIEGTLTMPDGTPSARNGWVRAVSQDAGTAWHVWARVDEQGRFALRGLAPGRYQLTGRGYGDGRYTVEKEGVTDGTRDVKLVLKKAEE